MKFCPWLDIDKFPFELVERHFGLVTTRTYISFSITLFSARQCENNAQNFMKAAYALVLTTS